MGRQKMTKKHVLMIHHLRQHKKWTYKSIAEFVGLSIEGTRNIIHHDTWPELSTPEFTLGEELFYHYVNHGHFE